MTRKNVHIILLVIIGMVFTTCPGDAVAQNRKGQIFTQRTMAFIGPQLRPPILRPMWQGNAVIIGVGQLVLKWFSTIKASVLPKNK